MEDEEVKIKAGDRGEASDWGSMYPCIVEYVNADGSFDIHFLGSDRGRRQEVSYFNLKVWEPKELGIVGDEYDETNKYSGVSQILSKEEKQEIIATGGFSEYLFGCCKGVEYGNASVHDVNKIIFLLENEADIDFKPGKVASYIIIQSFLYC